MKVRVENLYYLLCYAWRCLDARDIVPVDAAAGPSPQALFARVMNVAVRRLIRERLDRGYLEESEDLRRPRGKPQIGQTLSRGLLERGVVRCEFDELTEDVLHNRIIKATVRRLSLVDGLDTKHRRELGEIVRSMAHITDAPVRSNDFQRVQIQGNRRRYRFLLNVCQLVHRCVLLDERTGRWRFDSFTGDEQSMGRLFQEFLVEFLKVEQQVFTDVRAPQVPWDLDGDDGGLLPTMNTDIVLRRPGHALVVEAKCYATPLVSRFGGRGTLHADHVYQLLAYVSNLAVRDPAKVSGMLVYAVDGDAILRASFKIQGHAIQVLGINLNQPWQAIHGELLRGFGVADPARIEVTPQ